MSDRLRTVSEIITEMRSIFYGMKQRCHNSNAVTYNDYGAKGISVCPQWREPGGFDLFFKDIGLRPSKLHSVDRIDGKGNYEPGNVRWATQQEQSHNRNNSKVSILYRGELRYLNELIMLSGLSAPLVRQRLKQGMELEKALMPGDKRYGGAVSQYTVDEKLLTTFESLTEAAKITGIARSYISNCLTGKQRTAGGFIWKDA